MAELEGQIAVQGSSVSSLTSELANVRQELEVARKDTKTYSDSAVDIQSLYQSELVQHGRSMEELLTVKEKVQHQHGGEIDAVLYYYSILLHVIIFMGFFSCCFLLYIILCTNSFINLLLTVICVIIVIFCIC